MVCIYCGGSTQVINSRLQKKSNQTWRRRQCGGCHNIFTTLEGADLYTSVLFRRSPTALEPFNRDKLMISVYDSLRHRKDAQEAATALTGTILAHLMPPLTGASIDRAALIGRTTKVLKRFDPTAATIYSAYYPL